MNIKNDYLQFIKYQQLLAPNGMKETVSSVFKHIIPNNILLFQVRKKNCLTLSNPLITGDGEQ